MTSRFKEEQVSFQKDVGVKVETFVQLEYLKCFWIARSWELAGNWELELGYAAISTKSW